MIKCKDCNNYNQDDVYTKNGYCELWEVHVKENDSCPDYKEEEDG